MEDIQGYESHLAEKKSGTRMTDIIIFQRERILA